MLRAVNAELAGRLARWEWLVSRSSGNSSMPPSRGSEPGKTPPDEGGKRAGAVPGMKAVGGASSPWCRGRAWLGVRTPMLHAFRQGVRMELSEVGRAPDPGAAHNPPGRHTPLSNVTLATRLGPG
jgi:hypothetical protein